MARDGRRGARNEHMSNRGHKTARLGRLLPGVHRPPPRWPEAGALAVGFSGGGFSRGSDTGRTCRLGRAPVGARPIAGNVHYRGINSSLLACLSGRPDEGRPGEHHANEESPASRKMSASRSDSGTRCSHCAVMRSLADTSTYSSGLGISSSATESFCPSWKRS